MKEANTIITEIKKLPTSPTDKQAAAKNLFKPKMESLVNAYIGQITLRATMTHNEIKSTLTSLYERPLTVRFGGTTLEGYFYGADIVPDSTTLNSKIKLVREKYLAMKIKEDPELKSILETLYKDASII